MIGLNSPEIPSHTPRLAPDPPPPPEHLGEPERQLWNDLFQEYGLEGVVAETLLETALCSHQRARMCSAIIQTDGAVIKGRNGQSKPHPLLSAERRAWATYMAGIQALRLDC